MKGVNIFLADGFEDVEALATFDVLRRGGVDASLVALTDDPDVESSHGVTVCPDSFLPELDDAECFLGHGGTTAEDVMIFPGGMPGSKNLAACTPLIQLMQAHYDAGGSLAAICAAPGLVLSQLRPEILQGMTFTCFDGFQDALIAKGAVYKPAPAVRSGRIVTGRSAGHAIAFALEILRGIKGDEIAAQVHHALFLAE